jgi:hypothetical protein
MKNQLSPTTNYQLPILLILLVATFLRFHQLPSLPPGLNFDEAGNGVAAVDILNGSPRIWWRIGGGKEPFWPHIIALSTLLLGPIPLALRFPAAIIGILSVASVYPLMKSLFRRRQAYIIALLTMLGLALSDWHLHFSRLGFRAILLPLLSTLAFYFLWRNFTAPHRVSGFRLQVAGFDIRVTGCTLAALLMALAIYSYLAARFLPLVLILFFSLAWLIHHFQLRRTQTKHSHTTNDQLRTPNYHPFIVRLFAPLFLGLIPLMFYFAFNPTDFTARSTTVSIFNPAWHNGDLIGTGWRTLVLTLGSYLGLGGDPNPLVNLPRQPILPPVLAPFFILGIATSLYRIIYPGSSVLTPPLRLGHTPRPRPSPTPNSPNSANSSLPVAHSSAHLFLVCWWSVMLLPAILAPEGAPHHLRLLGTIIPTYALVALGFVSATHFLARLLSHTSRLTYLPPATGYLLPAICYLLLGLQTYTNYFTHWPHSVDFTLPFDLYATRLAADIAQTPPNITYVLPMDIRAGIEARHYTLDYLLTPYQSPIPAPSRGAETNDQLPTPSTQAPNLLYTYLPVDEHNAETWLTQAAGGKEELRIVRWTADKHREADAKEIVTYLLETTAHHVGHESLPVHDVETYSLVHKSKSPGGSRTFTLPPISHPIGANFDGLLRLDAAFVPTSISPGDWLTIALTLTPLAPMETDFKASVRLLSPAGDRLSQKDRTLMHNFHQGTSLWPVESVNEYYLLSTPPDIPPGDYPVVVIIYRPDTLAPLVADGLVEVPLGTVKIE